VRALTPLRSKIRRRNDVDVHDSGRLVASSVFDAALCSRSISHNPHAGEHDPSACGGQLLIVGHQMKIDDDVVNMFSNGNDEKLLQLFRPELFKCSESYHWDEFVSSNNYWQGFKYVWIGVSSYGDHIVDTQSGVPDGIPYGILMMGPDVAGPRSPCGQWPECMLYLGNSIDSWLIRVKEYGDEYSIAPGSINDALGSRSEQYKQIYRKMNPGLQW
jgi:hypothetical protein